MADPTEEPRPEETEEDGGGPVKTFLEHLEDLRWMLIKSGSALLVGMIVCLYATDKVVSILKWPLERAALIQIGHKQKVLVKLGEEVLFSFQPQTNHFGPLDFGTNAFVIVHLEPVEAGTNVHFVARVLRRGARAARAARRVARVRRLVLPVCEDAPADSAHAQGVPPRAAAALGDVAASCDPQK